MSRKALIVEFHCKPDRVDDFIAFATTHAQRVRDNEPGCTYFDVSVDADDPTTVFLYEVYADDAALETHTKQPYMPGFVEGFQPMVKDRSRRMVSVAND